MIYNLTFWNVYDIVDALYYDAGLKYGHHYVYMFMGEEDSHDTVLYLYRIPVDQMSLFVDDPHRWYEANNESDDYNVGYYLGSTRNTGTYSFLQLFTLMQNHSAELFEA